MGNKLRSMLNHKDENYTLTVHFNNEEERKEGSRGAGCLRIR